MGIEQKNIPYIKKTGLKKQLMVEGEPYIMLAGEVHNSSASSLEYMEKSWQKLLELNCNTALVPLYWELVEPEPGQFNFNLIDGLIHQAREYGLRLVFLWFGTYKNADSSYVPEWVKTDLKRFPRAQNIGGINTSAITCFSEAACKADAEAFKKVMRHIKQVDKKENTVIMMQIENEVGILGSARDHSPQAEKAFKKEVPFTLINYLQENKSNLRSELVSLVQDMTDKENSSWKEVFGNKAEEIFMSWHFARFVNKVAKAGKEEYPLPMLVNSWLVQYPDQSAGDYPSGGPVAPMMDIWKAGAPEIEVMAPDIYLNNFKEICNKYVREDNPLFIPETSVKEAPARVFFALGQFNTWCFSPFGIDDKYETEPLSNSYEFLGKMLPLIAKYQGSGKMKGIVEGEKNREEYNGKGYRLTINYNQSDFKGRGIIIGLKENKFLIVGAGFSVDFRTYPDDVPHVGFLSITEGSFDEAGNWSAGRRLNGDELKVDLGKELTALQVKLYKYGD